MNGFTLKSATDWLIYSDWLEERGEPLKAAKIRQQAVATKSWEYEPRYVVVVGDGGGVVGGGVGGVGGGGGGGVVVGGVVGVVGGVVGVVGGVVGVVGGGGGE